MEEWKKEMLAVLREERQLLIEKIRIGTILAVAIIVPTMIYISILILNKDRQFPLLETVAHIAIPTVLLIINMIPIYFVVMNYFRYQKIEEITDQILFHVITEKELFEKIQKNEELSNK